MMKSKIYPTLALSLFFFIFGYAVSYQHNYKKIFNQSRFLIYEMNDFKCDKNPENIIFKIPEISNSRYFTFVDYRDMGDVTPLYISMRSKCYEDMETMLEYGADPNQKIDGQYLIDIAIEREDSRAIDLLEKYIRSKR